MAKGQVNFANMGHSEFPAMLPQGIVRYTPQVRAWLEAANTGKELPKAEPWLHLAIMPIDVYGIDKPNALMFAIYVWDTRKVVYSGATYKIDNTDDGNWCKWFDKHTSKAIDNGQPLAGLSGALARSMNDYIKSVAKHK